MKIPNWLVSISVAVNNLTGGPKGYSLCARFWEGRLDGKPFHSLMVNISDRIFWFDPEHCRKAWLLRKKA